MGSWSGPWDKAIYTPVHNNHVLTPPPNNALLANMNMWDYKGSFSTISSVVLLSPKRSPLCVTVQPISMLTPINLQHQNIKITFFFFTSFSFFPQICRALDRKKEFTPAVLYQPLSQEVQGLRSLEQYQKSEEDHGRVDELRQMGLTAQEIEWVNQTWG